MPADQLVLLAIGLAAIAAVAVTVAYATSHTSRSGVGNGTGSSTGPAAGDQRAANMRGLPGEPVDLATTRTPATGEGAGSGSSSAFISPASTRQVARVVAFLFLAACAVVVALTGAWEDQQAGIFTLLAGGTLLVVLSMDMVPPAVLGRWRRPVEGVGAVIFLGLLMALTGGVGSPFFVGFFLVVAGAALSTEGWAPLAIALVAGATVTVVGVAVSFEAGLDAQGLAWIGFNAVALILLADIATAAARAQRQARDEALRASRFDALTGLYNRSFFFTTMEQEIRRSDRMGRGFTMLMLDLDDLKPVNDTFGHQWGDRLLRAIADVVRDTVRFTDSAARYGGDEFVVLLPETDAAGGFVVGEKLRRDIAALTLHAADRNVRSSVSVGLVTYPDDGTTIEQLVAAADVAMYEAKRRGKNRIVGYQTRMERVATAIDAASAELVQHRPGGDVRTGGDPAPWGSAPVAESRLDPSRGRRYDERGTTIEAIPIEPETTSTPSGSGHAPWDGPVASATEPPASSPPPAEPPATQPRVAPAPPPAASPPETSRSPLPPAEPPAPPPTGVATADADALASDQPWLTRTEDQTRTEGPSERQQSTTPADGPGPSQAPPKRPAADEPAARGSRRGGREPSRSEEIRSSGERPWIALPIEPYDPPELPKG